MVVHPAVYILSVAPSTTQPLRYPPELKSEKQTVFPGRKLELEVAIHFEPPNLLKICNCLESTLWQADKNVYKLHLRIPIYFWKQSEKDSRNVIPIPPIIDSDLCATIERNGPTKHGENVPFGHAGGAEPEQILQDIPVIGGQFGLPDEIRRRGGPEGPVNTGQLADLRRFHVGQYQSHTRFREGVFCALGFGSEGGSDEDFE
nr:hypothetical protein TorRG33x02_278400 [Ipomoea trifida]